MAMKSFVVKRGPGYGYFDHLIKIYNWCREVFGKEDHVRWNINFARGTVYYVEFNFRDGADASAFVFQWGNHCVSKEQQFKLGLCSWNEV
jgi:hypothetical protein